MFLASFVLYFLLRVAQVPGGLGADLSVGGLLGGGLFLVFPLVGALIASRRPDNPIGWICLAVGLLWMLIGVSDFYGVYGVARPGTVPFPVVVAGINNVDVGARRGTVGNLPAPALPRREAPLE